MLVLAAAGERWLFKATVSFELLETEPICDVIPLTAAEKALKTNLESVVEGGLQKFLEVGAALVELRNRRLYRTQYATFEAYLKSLFGLHRASVDAVIRSTQTAQVLVDAGIELPPDTTATLLRPISGLPTDELQVAVWQLVTSVAPERQTQPLVSRLCRMVRNALDGVDETEDDCKSETGRSGFHVGPRKRSVSSPEREESFVRPLLRLSSWQGFSLEVVVSHAEKLEALYFATVIGQFERNSAEVERYSSDLIELSTRHNFVYWPVAGMVFRGWGRSTSGDTADGMVWIENGVTDYRASGAMLAVPFYLALKAEVLQLDAITEAEAMVARTEERWWFAELRQLSGVFLAALGAEEAQIEASFCEATRIAKEQKSVSLQERAETTYAEYCRQKASGSGRRGFRLPLW
jgi:hypothetical protein